MKAFTRFKFFLWYFGRFKVSLIGHLKPRLITLNDKTIVIKLPLSKRSKNHLNSMYFGALAVGADLAGGLHGFYHADHAKVNISLVFKSFQAQFLRRPETDVYFVSESGDDVGRIITQSKETGLRINHPVKVIAYVNYLDKPEEVAHFILELSLKVI